MVARPEGTKTEEVNPLIAIIAFDSACLPGVHLPKSTDDTDAIRQVATQISRSLSGSPFIGKGQNRVRAFALQNRLMLDLSSTFKVDMPSRKQPFDVFTSVIFTEDNGYWVMWMFMNGSQSGLDGLRKDIKIAFAPSSNGTSFHSMPSGKSSAAYSISMHRIRQANSFFSPVVTTKMESARGSTWPPRLLWSERGVSIPASGEGRGAWRGRNRFQDSSVHLTSFFLHSSNVGGASFRARLSHSSQPVVCM